MSSGGGGGGGGGHDVAAALRKAIAFCERKFCEANLPSADNADEVADLEGAMRGLRTACNYGPRHTGTLDTWKKAYAVLSRVQLCSFVCSLGVHVFLRGPSYCVHGRKSTSAPGGARVSGRASALLGVCPGTAWLSTGCCSCGSPTYLLLCFDGPRQTMDPPCVCVR